MFCFMEIPFTISLMNIIIIHLDDSTIDIDSRIHYNLTTSFIISLFEIDESVHFLPFKYKENSHIAVQ